MGKNICKHLYVMESWGILWGMQGWEAVRVSVEWSRLKGGRSRCLRAGGGGSGVNW